jgi:AmiR/NasT family two-component response regulator
VDAFDATAENIALVIAAEVANALVKSTLLRTARTTREELQEQHDESALVSMATGILIAVQDCSAAQAEQLLRNAATTNDEHITDTAQRILASARVNDHAPGSGEIG